VGNAPAVSILTTVASPADEVPYLNHALISFVPENTTFRTNFTNSTADWMLLSPTTLQGLVAEVGPDTWQSRLKSLGATDSEPIWTACAAFFGPLNVADGNGNRERVTKPDVLYLGRRTSAVVSINTFKFLTNTAGRTRVKINPATYLYSDSSPVGALADTTVVADGVLTVADLADDLAAQLTAITDFAAHFTAVSDGVDTVTVTSLQPGYPLIMVARSSTPGPTFTQTVTTANVANAYYDDLTEMQQAAEFGALVTPPRRRYYWQTDLQGDDTVNAEGMEWVQDQYDPAQFTPRRDYQFLSWSTSGGRALFIGANQVGNFVQAATASAAGLAHVANGGAGWTRASVHDHPMYEFLAVALLGRTIGYLPGDVSFTAKVLQGDTDAAKVSPLEYGDNESLTLADERSFNYYSADGPGLDGMAKWGYTCDGSFMDRPWLADYVTYKAKLRLLQWMVRNNITTYTDPTLAAGAAVIAAAIAEIPAVLPDTIAVTFAPRSAVNPADIVARVYFEYVGGGTSGGIINRFGTPSSPIPITIVDG
jgi:hypothetical protein